MSTDIVVTLCGTGASAHALAGLLATTDGVEPRILTRDSAKARRWNALLDDGVSLTVSVEAGGPRRRHVARDLVVTDRPEDALAGCDVVVFAIPAFTHTHYLELIRPHLEPGCLVVGLPGQNGFELEVRSVLGDLYPDVVLMSFDSLPWICRLVELGREVSITGIKRRLVGAVDGPLAAARLADPVGHLQSWLGRHPRLEVSGHLLGVTLMALNAYSHPPLMYGRWKDWDGRGLEEPPYLYRDVDAETAELLTDVSAEAVTAARRLMERFPGVDLTQVIPMYEWDLACYGDVIEDTTDQRSVLRTNPGYRDIRHPMIQRHDGLWVPDFDHRFLTEDVPFGLAVVRGVAELAGVATPRMDEVLRWSQERLGAEYLASGRMQGRDLGDTRCPQRYGIRTAEELLFATATGTVSAAGDEGPDLVRHARAQ